MKEESVPVIKPQDALVSKEALAMIPRNAAERYLICPIALSEPRNGIATLTIAMQDTANLMLLDQLTQITACRINPVLAAEQDIKRAIEKYYGSDYVAAPTDFLQQYGGLETVNQESDQTAQQNPIVEQTIGGATNLVENILQRAITDRASDIHIEPHPGTVYVRFRVDGVLYDYMGYDIVKHPQVVSRIKILSKLDIAQNRLPQDGRFEVNFGNKSFDIRISVMPAITGEKVVLRMLPKGSIAMDFGQLGLTGKIRSTLEEMILKPFGMILVTGPTGSGKTTTLYASLAKIDTVGKNVLTIEDPIEYQFPRITQVQVHPKIGLTFAAGLRSFLRQDPDIIMVGEIRDLETLQMAIQAALTGHLVLTTLHCNDSAAGTARMVDMGAEPFLISSAVSCIIAQRLLRKICLQCRIKLQVSDIVREKLNLPNDDREYYIGKGCTHCRGTGYSGRIGVYEILIPNEAIHHAILSKASASEIRNVMKESGMVTMRDDGIEKARAGITSLEEVMRAIYVE